MFGLNKSCLSEINAFDSQSVNDKMKKDFKYKLGFFLQPGSYFCIWVIISFSYHNILVTKSIAESWWQLWNVATLADNAV